MPKIVSIVKPDLLIWARKSAGMDVDQAAKKAQVKSEQIEAWERGEKHPSIPQLQKLCVAYKRPLAVLYLPEPPKSFAAMHDFRRLPGEVAGVESPELRLEIRRAKYRREVALELFEDVEGAIPEFEDTASTTEEPEELGLRIRNILGITHEAQTGWGSEYEAFSAWRSAIEARGVLVFQATDVPLDEMRGFSISETSLPVIVVNIKDYVLARIFSLIHEFTHVLLREGGLCDLSEDAFRPAEEDRMEVYCNRVSGAALVPSDKLLREPIVEKLRGPDMIDDEGIGTLSRRYSVSREVLLRRLLIFRRVTSAFYTAKREQYQREWERREKREGFAPPAQMALSSVGDTFARLVLSGYEQDKITASDLSDYLEIRLKHMGKIAEKIARRMAK